MNRTRLQILVFSLIFAAFASVATAQEAAVAPPYPGPQVRAWQTGVLRPDRLQHASLAMTLALSGGIAVQSPAAGFGGALGLGILKEFLDARGDRFDWFDLAADTGGAVFGAVVTRALTR